MASAGSILIADDEETFRESTTRLLQREGFECHSARDVEEAVDRLQQERFDVLLADIRMPHNPELRVVREAQRLDSQMPVILVTAYPSTDTAIRSVEMSVVAYLTKPLDFDILVARIHEAVKHSRNRRKLSAVRERLCSCVLDLEAVESKRLPRGTDSEELIANATIRTLASCLSELLEVASQTRTTWEQCNLCELLDCPQEPVHRHAIEKTIKVLKETKDKFKSKMLGELRVELETLLDRGQECSEVSAKSNPPAGRPGDSK